MSTAPEPLSRTASRSSRIVLQRALRPGLAVARRAVLALLRAQRPPGSSAPADPSASKVSILVFNAYNAGGIMRSVLSMIPELAKHYQVDVVSVTRDRDVPHFALPDGVTVTVLADQRRPTLLGRVPSLLWHDADGAYPGTSAQTDVALVRKLRAIRSGVVMGTRPGMNNIIAELAAPAVITVGQVHADLGSQHPALVRAMRRHYRRLDALTVLSADHERDYRAFLAGTSTRIVRIPNAVPASTAGISTTESHVLIAAARMFPEKGYDVLLSAFALVVADHPDWELHVFGEGPLRGDVQAQAHSLGLDERVHLRGLTDRLDEEMARASIFVLSSRAEGFPMVLLEAMSRGLAVVSTDCDHGPRDIIAPGVNGLLVPVDDPQALAAAVSSLIRDPERRRELGARALQGMEQYSPGNVGALWVRFVGELAAPRSTAPVIGPVHPVG